ncbi:hypothetical protein [Mesorhizobium sp. M1136]|uniref:hypothetical protein n=1 Tax=Mesorhizobium sp. M1136 TaxID=2957059 RepID=UPI003334FD2B
MSDIIVNRLADIDPQVADLAEPIVQRWTAAMTRVAAAHKQQGFMPNPPVNGSIEDILAKRFNDPAFPQVKRDRAADEAIRFAASPFLKRRTGLTAADLQSSTPVDQLVGLPTARLTRQQLSAMVDNRPGIPNFGGGVAAALPGTLRSLDLEIIRVVCIDETNGPFGTERGQDEIYIGGVALNSEVEVGKVGPTKMGDFDDIGSRRQKDFNPDLRLYSHDLTKDTVFPSSYFVTLVMFEKDQGNLNDTVNEIVNKVKDDAITYLSALIGTGTGSLAGPLGALVGLAVGYIVGKVIKGLVSAWEDDPFLPVTIEVHVPSSSANAGGPPSKVMNFTGPGEYAVRYQWKLRKIQGGFAPA